MILILQRCQDGADHMSETGSHDSFLKMMQMAVAPYAR